MKYAIIKLGTKQFKVQEGDVFEVETQKMPLKIDVLFLSDEGKVSIGNPILLDVPVKASIVEEKRGAKVRVNRFKAKSRYHKFGSHRQPLSVIKVEKIGKASDVVEKTESVKIVKSAKAAEIKVKEPKEVKSSKPKTAVKKAPVKAKTAKKTEVKK
jgi:large subunit ribosomal protein L21